METKFPKAIICCPVEEDGQSTDKVDFPVPRQTEISAATNAESSAGTTDDMQSTAASEQKVLLPDIGDFTDVEIIEIHVKVGDDVVAEDPILTLESDKATMDVPSPVAGKITELAVKIGDKISEGDYLLSVASGVPGVKESTTQQPDTKSTDDRIAVDDDSADKLETDIKVDDVPKTATLSAATC